MSNSKNERAPMNIVMTFYGPKVGHGKNAYYPVVKKNRGSDPQEVLSNIMRHLSRNSYGATVVEAHDEEYGELLLVVTYHIGESMKIMFEADRKRPVLLTDFPEKGENHGK